MFHNLNSFARASIASFFACASLLPGAQADNIAPENAKADLARLYSGLVSAEADLFAATPKAVFDRHYHELVESYTKPVSVQKFYNDLQKFTALARHGHTRLEGLNPAWSEFAERDGKVFPLSFSIHQGEVIITSAPLNSDINPGDRITSINGKANPIWLAELTETISAETASLAHSLLTQGEFYYFWLVYGEQEAFEVSVEREARSIHTKLNTVPLGEVDANSELEVGFTLSGREAKVIDDKIGYLRPGPFFHFEAETPADVYNAEALADYTHFIDAAFESFVENKVEHLILDLRDNPGGDSSFSDPVIIWFATEPFRFASEFRIRVSDETTASNQARIDAGPPGASGVSQRFADLFASAQNGDLVNFEIPMSAPRDGAKFTNEVHVLINRFSYSNAVNVAALIQDYGFGAIYGEETRDMATTYGAMEHFHLPNSGFKVGYPKAHIIRPNGKTESHPVTPDIGLPAPAVRGEEDVMLNAMVQKIRSSDGRK